MLALAGPEPGELAPAELEMLSRSLMGTLLRLARERDVGAQVGAAGVWFRGPRGGMGGPRGPRRVGEMGVEAQVWGWGWGSLADRAVRAKFRLW